MTYPRWLAALVLKIRPALLGQWVKRILFWKRQEVLVKEGRFWVDLASNFGIRVTSTFGYETSATQLISSYMSPGMVFVDLGANEGYFSVIASRLVGPSGRVIAIEPQARLEPVIRRNFEINQAHNARLVRVAISNEDGTREFNLAPDTNSGSSGLARATRYSNPTQSVRTMTLEKFLTTQNTDFVDVMKIDIEGFEYEAIMGSIEVFKRRRIRRILVEIHGKLLAARGHQPSQIVDFLTACGYRRESFAGFEVFTVPSDF